MRLLTLIQRSAGQAWYALVACTAVVGGFQFLLAGQAATMESTLSFGRMAEFLPAFLQRGLGEQALWLASFQGMVAFGYFHPLVVMVVTLAAMYFATEPAHDVESGRVDLLLARPLPRRRVITRSLLLSTATVVLLVSAMAAGTAAGLNVFAPSVAAWPRAWTIFLLIAHMASLAWCCAAFGLAVAAGAKRWSVAFTVAALTTIAMYLIDFLAIVWPRVRPIAWLSPFRYYPGASILAGTAPIWRNLIVLWAATALFAALAYWRFQRRDL